MTLQLATERDARREVARHKRARSYSGPGFGPRSFECVGLGIGIDIGIGDTVSGPFNGNFSALFTTPYYFCQADRGLTYGTTPRATAGNTSATVLTLGGSTPSTPVPVLAKATNTATVGSGATFSIYYDGGTTPAMTGVALNTTPTALTGLGTGLTLAASVASSVNNDTWKATSASQADQSGNSNTFGQATASKQPVVTVGANGHIGLLFDGLSNFLACAGFTQIAGMMLWMVVKQLATGSFLTLVGSDSANNHKILFQDGSSGISMYDSATLAGGVLTIGTVGRVAATYNGASSSIKVGSNAVVNGTSGVQALAAGRCVGCDKSSAALNFANVELYAWGEMPAQSFAVGDASASTYWGAAI